MTDFDKVIEEIKEYFKLRGYHEITINLYSNWLSGLFKFYPTTVPSKISEHQIKSYISILTNRKLSYSSVNQFLQAADFFYNQIHKKDFKFDRKLLPRKTEKVLEILSQEQVFLIIDNIQNIKHKTIVSLLYSCGLEVSELINIKHSDIKSKNKPPRVVLHDNYNRVSRQTILSKKVLELMREYWIQYQPKTWLFEGGKEGTQYSSTSVRKVVSDAFRSVGFTMDSEIKVLKHSYIKHLVELGVPLIVVMKHLDIKINGTIERYTNFIHGESNVTFSPYDKLIGKSEIKEPEIEDLEKLVFTLTNTDEIEYLMEAISCFRVGALKAGIVFSWAAAARFLQNKCIEKGYKQINIALHKLNPGAKQIKVIEDFETIKDLTLLSISFTMKIISKHQKSQLENNLDLRNHCGHPSSYVPEINKAKAFIEDIVNLMKIK